MIFEVVCMFHVVRKHGNTFSLYYNQKLSAYLLHCYRLCLSHEIWLHIRVYSVLKIEAIRVWRASLLWMIWSFNCSVWSTFSFFLECFACSACSHLHHLTSKNLPECIIFFHLPKAVYALEVQGILGGWETSVLRVL